MNKILSEIYCHNEDSLETPKIKKALDSFFTTYFGRFSYNEYDEARDILLNIISIYQKRAFETGFYAGIEMMRGNKN